MKLTRILTALSASVILIPTAFAASEGTPFYLDSTNWAFAVLVLFLILVWRLGAFKAMFGALDNRAVDIQRELDHAKELREEASAMLKAAERKQQEASELADTILRQAEADAKSLMVQADKDLADMVARREAQVEARISRAQDEATDSVKRAAADAATKAAASLIRAQADANNGSDAFKAALGEAKSAL